MNTTRTTRATEARKKTWTPPSKLDAPAPPAGYQYRWVRHELLNNDDASNVHERVRQGYEPVRAEEVGGMSTEILDKKRLEGVVRSGDLMLMKVPVEIAESRTDYYEGQARKMQQAVDMEMVKDGHSAMPFETKSESRVTRGQRTTNFDT